MVTFSSDRHNPWHTYFPISVIIWTVSNRLDRTMLVWLFGRLSNTYAKEILNIFDKRPNSLINMENEHLGKCRVRYFGLQIDIRV